MSQNKIIIFFEDGNTLISNLLESVWRNLHILTMILPNTFQNTTI